MTSSELFIDSRNKMFCILLAPIRDTEGYLVLRRQTCVFLAPSHSSSEPTVANRMYLPSELCAMTSTQCPAVLLAPTNASAAPSRRAERDTEALSIHDCKPPGLSRRSCELHAGRRLFVRNADWHIRQKHVVRCSARCRRPNCRKQRAKESVGISILIVSDHVFF